MWYLEKSMFNILMSSQGVFQNGCTNLQIDQQQKSPISQHPLLNFHGLHELLSLSHILYPTNHLNCGSPSNRLELIIFQRSIYPEADLSPSNSGPSSSSVLPTSSEWSLKKAHIPPLPNAPYNSNPLSLRVKTKDLCNDQRPNDLGLWVDFFSPLFSKFACSLQPHQEPHSFSNIPASGPLSFCCTCPLTSKHSFSG